MSRLATIGLSFALLIGLSASWSPLTAQDEAKKEAKQDDAKKDDAKKDKAPKDDAKKDDTKKDETKKDDAKKDEAKKEAQEGRRAPCRPAGSPGKARKSPQGRGRGNRRGGEGRPRQFVDRPSADPGYSGLRLRDRPREYAKDAKDRVGVSPEVFGAWFSGYGKKEANPSLIPQDEVRIFQPSKGLKKLYDQKATVFNSLLEAARKAQAEPVKPKEEAKPEPAKEEKPKDEKPAEEKKEDKPKEAAPKEEKPQ